MNPDYWRDVGTLDSYWQMNMDLLDKAPGLNLSDTTWPIRTYRRQLPSSRFIYHSASSPGIAINSLVANGCVIDGGLSIRSILFSGAQVGVESLITESLILPDARIGKNCQLHKVIVLAGMHVPDGTVLGENTSYDEKTHRVSESGVVLYGRQDAVISRSQNRTEQNCI